MASAGRVSSVFRPGLFKGKSAIVTGGATGIGSAITKELLYLGCNVMIASRKEAQLIKAAEQMKQSIPQERSGKLEYTKCNIRHEDEVKSLISTTLSKFGKLDYLVNNGGGQFISPAENISSKGWHAVVETNLYGTFYCCREAYNQWMKEHGGAIVNIIADMWKGMPGMSHSGAARAGVNNLTKTLAVEWASSGVRINAVAPGSSFPSPTAQANYDPKINAFERQIANIPAKRLGYIEEGSSFPSPTAAANYDPTIDVFGTQTARIPAKRLGNVHEVSAAVCYMLCPAAAFVSGECIKIDGAQNLYTPSLPWPIEDHSRYPKYSWETDVVEDDVDNPQNKSKL